MIAVKEVTNSERTKILHLDEGHFLDHKEQAGEASDA